VWRERQRKPELVGSPTGIIVAGVLSAGVIAALVVARPTWGAWTDDVAVSGATFTAAAAPPAPGGGTCSGIGSVTIRWNNVGAGYEYVVDIYRTTTGQLVGTTDVASTTAATQQVILAANQLGVTTNGSYAARVYSRPVGAPNWRSSSFLSVGFNRATFFVDFLYCN
jgi:hypothetical protein